MEQGAFVEKFAEKIHRLGLEVPALLFLELHRPFSSIFYNSALFSQPFLSPFLGGERMEEILEFLAKDNAVETLVKAIEEKRDERSSEHSP